LEAKQGEGKAKKEKRQHASRTVKIPSGKKKRKRGRVPDSRGGEKKKK